MITKQTRWAAIMSAAVVWFVAWWLPRDFGVGNYVDDAHYVVLAKSIRAEGTYRTLNLPGRPWETKYPPGFPAVLATAWSPGRSDADNLDRARWVNLFLAGPLAAVLAILGVVLFGLRPAMAGTLSVGGVLTPSVASLWTVPMSGTLFLLLLATGVWLWSSQRTGAGLAMLLAAVYVRTLAGAFVLAAVVPCVFHRRRGWRVMAASAVAGLAPWLVWQMLHGAEVPDALLGMYGSYGKWYLASLGADAVTVLLRVPIQNLVLVLRTFGDNLLGAGWMFSALASGVGAIVAVGLASAGRRHTVFGWGMAGYFVIVLVWPFPPARFVHAVWPLVLLGLASAAGPRIRAVLAAGTVLVAANGIVSGAVVAGHRHRSEMAENVIQRLESVEGSVGPLASTNPGLHYLRLGVETLPGQKMRSYRWYRLGFWSTAWGQADDLWPLIVEYRPSHVVVEPRGVEGRFVAGSLMGNCPGVLEPLWDGDLALLFLVDSDRPCNPTPSVR